jgi:hypothetical protein
VNEKKCLLPARCFALILSEDEGLKRPMQRMVTTKKVSFNILTSQTVVGSVIAFDYSLPFL